MPSYSFTNDEPGVYRGPEMASHAGVLHASEMTSRSERQVSDNMGKRSATCVTLLVV